MGSRGEIVWSPTYRDQFLVFDNEMVLYKLERYTVGEPVTISALTQWVSNSSTATKLCTNRDLSHYKCFDWHPRSTEFGQDLVAVGFANGRVLLTSPTVSLSAQSATNVDAVGDSTTTATAVPNSNAYDHHDDLGTVGGIRVFGKEFLPKHSRPCQSVRWNTHYNQWLAIGMERHRSDNGIFIWDIFSRSPSSATPVPYESTSSSFVHQHHPQPISQQYDIPNLQNQASPVLLERRTHSGLNSDLLSNHSFQQHQQSASTMSTGSASSQQLHHTRALYEFAGGETAHSLYWLKQSPKCLVCGISGKCVRLYDTRDLSRFQLQIATKAVYGVAVDPFSDQRICSFVDNQLFLWDLRHTEKPLVSISDTKPFVKLQWDPVRRNIVTSLSRDSLMIKVYHLQQIIAEETEVSYTETSFQPPFMYSEETSNSALASIISYDWHPQEECHMVCMNSYGTITDYWVNERLCVQWSSDGGRLLTTFGKLIAELKHFHLNDDTTPVGDKDDELLQQQEEDVSTVMHRRALLGYGIIGDSGASDDSRSLKQNAELCLTDGGPNAAALYWTWTWMDKLKQMSECEPVESWPYDNSFPGAMQVLRVGFGAKSVASTIEYRSMSGLDAATGHTSMFRVYVSPERDRVIQFCGWGSMHMTSRDRSFSIGGGDVFFQDLLDGRQAERAAAIALFTLRLRLAVQILTKAAATSEDKNHYLQLTALALAGYPGAPSDREQGGASNAVGVVSTPTPLTLNQSSSAIQTSAVSSIVTPTSLWFDQCNTILPKISNPYLKAMFQFLACRATGGNNFESLLESSEFPLHDKVAFAAIFAPDQRLEELVTSLARQCVMKGDLYGLLLTGLASDQSLELIQRYIDTTGDVQTGALLIIHGGVHVSGGEATPSSATSATGTTATTITARDTNVVSRVVDGYFGLLDAWGLWHVRAQTNALYVKRSQHLAGKITPQVYITCTYCARSIWAGAGGRMRQRMHKLGSCPSCKKPLPRCALCRLNVGMPLASDQDSSKPNKFASWFAWCQSCRHGGHAQHLSDWFTTNNECPVTGCSCKCAALDSSSDFSQLLLTLMKNDA